MLVLRVDQRIGIRTQILTHLPEDHMRGLATRLPQVDGGHLPAAAHDRVGQSDLAIEFERASLHRQGARRRTWLRGLIDDADTNAQPSQPQGQHQARRSGADDEDVRLLLSHDVPDSIWYPRSGHDDEAEEHDLPVVRQGRA